MRGGRSGDEGGELQWVVEMSNSHRKKNCFKGLVLIEPNLWPNGSNFEEAFIQAGVGWTYVDVSRLESTKLNIEPDNCEESE